MAPLEPERAAASRGAVPPKSCTALPTAAKATEPSAVWLRSGDVKVDERDRRGRCAIAARRLDAGLLLSDVSGRPYAACLLPAQQAVRCERCFNLTEGGAASLLRCGGHPRCGARYCSAACRNSDSECHQRGCALLADGASPLAALRAEGGPTSLGRLGMLVLASRCLWQRHARDAASLSDDDRAMDELRAGEHARGGPEAPVGGQIPAARVLSVHDELASFALQHAAALFPPRTSAAALASMLAKLKCNSGSLEDEGGVSIGVGLFPRGRCEQ